MAAIDRADTTDDEARHRFAADTWPLADLDRQYRDYIADLDRLEPLAEAGPQGAFVARVLGLHGFRRIILRDPLLPDDLLPPDWPGRPARLRLARLYRSAHAASELWLQSTATSAGDSLPGAPTAGAERFG
jgi:phenylacetic acid degradation operon negative regulatory protein